MVEISRGGLRTLKGVCIFHRIEVESQLVLLCHKLLNAPGIYTASSPPRRNLRTLLITYADEARRYNYDVSERECSEDLPHTPRSRTTAGNSESRLAISPHWYSDRVGPPL